MTDRPQLDSDPDLLRLAAVNLNLLVPLLALLEERSVTRAANRVGLSQPAMSHALARMRRLFDDRLLVRQGAAITLTPRAAGLIVPLRRALEQTASLINVKDFDPAVDSRVITVTMTIDAAFVIGIKLSRLLSQRAPKVTLRLRTVMQPSDSVFTQDGVDLALLPDTSPSAYERERLYDDRWVVIAPADSPPQASATELLETYPHVAFDGGPERPAPYQALEQQRVPFTVRDFVSDNLLIPNLVAGTGAVAVHHYRVAAAMAKLFKLRFEEFPFPLPRPGFDMVWNPWLADEGFMTWMRGILGTAAASVENDAGLP